jgi:hypothetical protein
MPRYTNFVTEAGEQYTNLPETTRRLADQRIQELLENPIGNPDNQYDRNFINGRSGLAAIKGWIVAAVVSWPVGLALLSALP